MRAAGNGARALAWVAIVGQILFTVSWVVAGALDAGYSHAAEGVSALSAKNAEHPWIVTTGFVVLGLSVAALAPALLTVLPRRRATWVAAGCFALTGLILVLIAVFPIDCGLSDAACRARFDAGRLSTATDVHLWLGLAMDVPLLLSPFALAVALWPAPAALLSLWAALGGIGVTAISFVIGDAGPDGIAQRLGWLAMHAWVVIVAIGVLHVVGRRRATAAFVPVRPREFFGRGWEGDGELVPQPLFLWRHLPQRVHFRREIRWLSDDAWIVTDSNAFATGYELERRMVCSMDGDDRIRVTASDMPDGAELELAEGGYRVRPYRYAFPVGPLRFTFTCHDHVEERADGSLEWTIDFRWHGLPASRLTGRVRPVGA
jgi:hypothetical protein